MSSSTRPVILLPACNQPVGSYDSHTVARQYVEAVRLAGGMPLVVPRATGPELDTLLGVAHGLLLTGSPSNVHPSHFGEDVLDPQLPLDPDRDAWTLPLLRRALEAGLPVLAICRGAQEMNVALGGSLHQAVHAVPGHDDHRSRDEDPLEQQWAPVHDVVTEPGSLLRSLTGLERFAVNSLHGQAVNRIADGLSVEARAPDGLVEAFRAPRARGFNLAVQWHPEWQAAGNPVSMALLGAFGEACRRYRDAAAPSGSPQG